MAKKVTKTAKKTTTKAVAATPAEAAEKETTAMQNDGGTFALVDRDNMIVELGTHESDRAAMKWFARRRRHTRHCTMVVLNLDPYKTPRVGDYVRVDRDGVATLVILTDTWTV